MKEWSLEEAINLVRALQPKIRNFGYHLALGGGVLNKGYSTKDIDLYFIRCASLKGVKLETDTEGLLRFLSDMWGEARKIGKDYQKKDDGVAAQPQAFEFAQAQGDNWAIAPAQPGVNVAQPPPANVFDNIIRRANRLPRIAIAQEYIIEDTEPSLEFEFKHAVTFYRNGNDRIDCFIF